MEQAEKKTPEQILASKGISDKSKHHSYEYLHNAVVLAMEEYASQFKSPPVIDEKEIEACPVCTEVPNQRFQRQYNTIHLAHETLNEVGVPPQDTLALRIKHLIKFPASLSSERAMEYGQWIIDMQFVKATDSANNELYWSDVLQKSCKRSDLFDIFRKEKGYLK